MEEHYAIKNGKLVITSTKQPNFFLKFLFICLLLGGATYAGYYYSWKIHTPPQSSHVISDEEYKKYKNIELSLNEALKREITNKQYTLNRDTLKIVLNEIFPKDNMDEKIKEKYIDAAIKWGAHYSIPPLLILSIAYRESLFDASQVSAANARGPMQVIYKYHKDRLEKIGKTEKDLHDIDTGIRIGTEVFRAFYDYHKKNIFKAMMSYVGGNHRSYAEDILSRYFKARIFAQDVQK